VVQAELEGERDCSLFRHRVRPGEAFGHVQREEQWIAMIRMPGIGARGARCAIDAPIPARGVLEQHLDRDVVDSFIDDVGRGEVGMVFEQPPNTEDLVAEIERAGLDQAVERDGGNRFRDAGDPEHVVGLSVLGSRQIGRPKAAAINDPTLASQREGQSRDAFAGDEVVDAAFAARHLWHFDAGLCGGDDGRDGQRGNERHGDRSTKKSVSEHNSSRARPTPAKA